MIFHCSPINSDLVPALLLGDVFFLMLLDFSISFCSLLGLVVFGCGFVLCSGLGCWVWQCCVGVYFCWVELVFVWWELLGFGQGGGPNHALTSLIRILSWNRQGAGRAPIVRTIKALSRCEEPNIIFVAETKVSSPRIENIRLGLGFAGCFGVDSVGKAGGLAIFWKLRVELEVVFSNKFAIAALIYSDPPHVPWLLIAAHGPPYFAHNNGFWSLMEDIILSFSGHWLMIGDLNCIASSDDKQGGSFSNARSFQCFQNFI